MGERDRVFKRYCNENNPTLTVAEYNQYKNARNLVKFKVKIQNSKSKKEHYQNYFPKNLKYFKKAGTV